VTGCSYRYNIGVLPTHQDSDGFLPSNRPGWVPDPSRFILMSEPPALEFPIKPLPWIYHHWHERQGPEDVLFADLPADPSKFLSPVVFVDGHVKRHDFTANIKKNAPYIYEETKDWIWYKPKE
jgi:prepilin-type processing-associated H-X9-DG protein